MISSTVFPQVTVVRQGHDLDDIYVEAYKNYYPNRAFYHITGYGSQISTQYEYPQNTTFTYFIADPTPGVLIGKLAIDPGYSISHDYGMRWVPIANLWNKPGDVIGGGVAGECYFIFYLDQDTMNPCYAYSMAYSTDFGNTIHTLYDTCQYYVYQAGHQPGELYRVQMTNGYYEYKLLRSTDYGQHFDTTFISVTPGSSTNFYQYFSGLHRGSMPGELFLVVADLELNYELITYHIYHSTDYGQNWMLKKTITKLLRDGSNEFASGRDNCSFYWVEHWNGDDYTPTRLKIHYSADCGQTFNTYEYQLAVPTGMPKSTFKVDSIHLIPNPAKDQVEISCNYPEIFKASIVHVISVSGQIMKQMNWNGEKTQLDLSGWSKGIYLIHVKGPSTDTFTKLIIE